MHEVELFVGLLVGVVLVALAARRIERIPHAVALVLGGIVVGLLPFAPEIDLDPEIILIAFLPPILYPSAFAFAAEDVRANLRPIAFLAVGLVLATMAAIAAVLHWVAGIPWAAGFVLGAVLAPTDPVAATSVIRASGAPDRLATILEGESLVNDGTSLTALRIAVAAVGGSFAIGSALGEFALVALAFVLAERLGVPGILATVLAGWVMGRRSSVVMSPASRLRSTSFWIVTQFLAESILFLLVGLQFAQVLNNPAARGATELAGLTALVTLAAIAIRMGWMFTVPYLAGLLEPGRRSLGALVAGRERVVTGVAGLRGAVSVAAALSIPATVGGTDFPERSTLIAVALGAIVLLLIVPALGLPAVLRASGLAGTGESAERERRARTALAEAALRRTDELSASSSTPQHLLSRVREPYEWRLARLRGEGDGDGDPPDAGTVQRLRREAVEAQRRELRELARHGEVHGEVLRELQRDLDMEESRLR